MQRSVDGLPPVVAQTFPEQYESLLAVKVSQLEGLLAEATGAVLPPTEVFESEREHFRMRANFKLWREEDEVHYVMYERDAPSKVPIEVPHYPMGSTRIGELMPPLRDALCHEPVLKQRVNDVRFLTTTTGDALVSLTYNRPIDQDGEWLAAAEQLAAALSDEAHDPALQHARPAVKLVGRSRNVKLVVGGERVSEVLQVRGRGECAYQQTEGAFSQPNARVCEEMLSWAVDATRDVGGTSDLCELYCGNGCFTVALAPNFRHVIATEMSKASVQLAEHNLASNAGCENVRVARLSAEDFVVAHAGERRFKRLDDAGIDLAVADRMETLFVDPPRAGLDETCRSLAKGFERVLYISCNPETLARDVHALRDTHRVTRVAAFDQFPYTPHLEAGVLLERRS